MTIVIPLMRPVSGRQIIQAVAAFAFAAVFMGSLATAAPETRPAAGFHDQVVSRYLDGNWEQLEADLAPSKVPAALSAADKSDVDYIRRSLGECRPAWWKIIKVGKKVTFHPVVWGHTMVTLFDPDAKSGLQVNFVGGEEHVAVHWDAADMDNPDQAEHGFTKGELSDLGVWLNLGSAQGWSDVPIGALTNLSDDARVQLSRYVAFRGNVAGAYYGTPRARRWGLWLDLAAWQEKYAKMEVGSSRKAVGAMFAAEVVAHADRYPSIRLPETLPDQGAEEKLTNDIKSWIERHALTLAEDKTLRDAIKTFAAANTGKVRLSGKVLLANGLAVALVPESDKAESEKRDEWFKSHLKSKAAR